MLTAFEMRAAAWRKMKEGALLPLLAGFALLFLLGSLFDAAVNLFGKWQGWITAVPILDVVDQLGITLEPDQEKALAAVTISQATPAYQAATLVVNALWEGVLAFGGSVIAIAAMRGGATAFQALSGFRWPFRTAGLGFLRMLLVFLWSLLLVVPGIRAAYSYRMAFYLLADHPDWAPGQAIAESKRLMHGHRWRLFCLDVSFLGWFLLVGVTRGLAGIFVMPYFATANAAFYEDLLDRDGR